jgi:hypothetical protein
MKTRAYNSLKQLVGAPGFEPGASCAQGRRNGRNNPPVFNVAAESEQLSRDSSMWLAVGTCAHLSVGWAQKLAQSAQDSHTGSSDVRTHPMRNVFRRLGGILVA